MEWFSAYFEGLSIVSAVIIGLCLAYMCGRILAPRWKLSWLAAAALAALCRHMTLPGDLQPLRMLLVLASAIVAAYALYMGSTRLRMYTAVTYVALVEICFFLSYVTLFASDPIIQRVVDGGLEGQIAPDTILTRVQITSVLLQSAMVAVFAVLLAQAARGICRLCLWDSEPLSGPEFLLILLPSASGLLLCVLMRTLILTVAEGYPMNIYDRYPPLMALVPAMLIIILASIVLSLQAVRRERVLAGEREEKLALKVQLDALQAQIQQSEEQERTVRRLRHDLANTVTVVADLAQHDPKALDSYLSDLKADVRSAAPEFQTGIPVADVLVAEKAQSLRRQVDGATFDASRLVFRSDLGVAPYDLGIILSNALDNAVEGAVASKRANPKAPCFVRASSFEEGDHVFVRVENSRDPSAAPKGRGVPPSTKATPGHGLGLRNISAISDKYNGAMDCEAAPTTFTLSVMLAPQDGRHHVS